MKIQLHDNWIDEIISKPDKIAEIVRSIMSEMDDLDRDKEHIWVFHLNAQNQIESIEQTSTGIIIASVAHPREIYRRAVMEAATIIMIAHNHPARNPTPSIHDDNLTKRLAEAGDILGILLLDHIIVSEDDFYSYKQEGKL